MELKSIFLLMHLFLNNPDDDFVAGEYHSLNKCNFAKSVSNPEIIPDVMICVPIDKNKYTSIVKDGEEFSSLFSKKN
jgi:hypothetical protein